MFRSNPRKILFALALSQDGSQFALRWQPVSIVGFGFSWAGFMRESL